MSDKKISSKHTNEEDDRRRDGHRKGGHRKDGRHSPLDRHSKSESSHNSKNNEKYERNDYRRHDNRSTDRSKRRDYGSDRKDSHRRRRHSSRSRSRSRSRDRYSHSSSSRRDDKTGSKRETKVEKVVTNESKPEKGIQHKNSLEIMRQQIREKTGISVPEYYNPGVINPIKFAEQEKKRKLLWSQTDNKNEV